ncbi:Oxidoreductase [human gut metagenome]|uniref:Oxidoreductase n=1 Tax=human gut metagenome TaxID=408170 RepID=W1YIL9_9ZZZZ
MCDTPVAAQAVDGVIEVVIGQGEDADYAEDGEIQEAGFAYDPSAICYL